ncbi:hypothetical protein B0H19DRAFT_1170529 [Mycena capillaripes]|nr:hypothetical protein B0H19DRAFT_1170529 [Mycena capillaripes]
MSRVQTPEAQSFLQRVLDLPKGPGAHLDPILKPSLEDETQLRRLFATDKAHARLSNPYVGLVDVFDAPADIRTTRARVVKDETDLSAQYVMPLSELNRREEGTPSMVPDLDEFKKNWGVFSEGSLSQLFDWNNVVAAGGSILACLTPLSEEAKVSKRSMRKYYHSVAYPTSDVDLFLWGLTPEQAEVKITKIYEAVRDSVPWDVTCVRTKHTVSIYSQYPYRSVQIVLRLYSSPAEILAGFDIDAPCCAYDGDRVYANPRAIVAMMRQCNTVDMTRRSPSYEIRLAKYSTRAFEVYVPSLSRADIDPTIYERSIVRVTGLARLLVFEKLTNTDERFSFLESRRTLRGRPNPLNQYNRRQKRKFKGDVKAETNALSGLEMNDYDVTSLHIPYGPGWDARRIDKLVYQTVTTYNPKNKGRRLHRHPAFFGTIQECMDDCCEYCPAPIDEDERKLQAEEDEAYIRGRISFIQDDPGRQTLSGSFNPIDVGKWSAQVYIGPTERFFAAIAAHDRAGVKRMLEEGQDVNRRDHVGRAPLHVAILCRVVDIACDLVDAGAQMTARLVDGRTTLHLAAQQDLLPVVRKLLERSAVNAEKRGKNVDEEEDKDKGIKADPDRPSSEEHWSSEADDMAVSDEEDGGSGGSDGDKPGKANAADKQQSEPPANVGDLPEDETDQPDVFDINLADWDMTFTAVEHAIVSGSLPIVEALLNAGADVKRISQVKNSGYAVVPLTLTIIPEDDERVCKIAERLILAGASSSVADQHMRTIFNHAVIANRPNLVATFLRCDPNGKAALNYLTPSWRGATSPLVSAVSLRNYSVIATMVAHGVQMKSSEEDVQRAYAASRYSYVQDKGYYTPTETALAGHDDIFRLLVDLGAEFNVSIKSALGQNSRPDVRRTLVDWVQYAVATLTERISELEKKLNPPEIAESETLPGWKGYVDTLAGNTKISLAKPRKERKATWEDSLKRHIEVRDYYSEMEKFLFERGAKSWNAVYPDNVTTASDPRLTQFGSVPATSGRRNAASDDVQYLCLAGGWNQDPVPAYLNTLYDELFEACFTGANEKIQELCLPVAKPKKDVNLLQIAVTAADEGGNRYSRSGLTPLFAAVAGRQWDTAQLVLAITAAQYKPTTKTQAFSTSNLNLEDDSDNESDNSDDSDGTVEQDAINFVDIANRPSTVECNTHPKDILAGPHHLSDRDLIQKAIIDDDFEAFVNVLNLYKHCPKHVDLPINFVDSIFGRDRVEMLDEYIRRTGSGIKVVQTTTDGEDEVLPVVNDKNKVYLGLSVHGKKRADLAKRNDPDAAQNETPIEVPLVWKALAVNATGILDYLQSDRPLAAYKFYASSNSTETARVLKRRIDLEKVLPEWLGWVITPLGESPLTAALASTKFDMVKYLFEKSPRLMASCLHERIKFLGVNPLMIAVQLGCNASIIDFLLARSVSPAQTDQNRGWNIFHYMCYRNSHKLLKHLLKKLPRDVVEALLAQQSKGRLNTPLHLCVKKGYKKAVKLVVEFSKVTALVRDVDGSIPLHCAVRSGFPKIIQILIDAAPSGLHMENGVGEAPLEIARLQHLITRKKQLQNQNYNDGPTELNSVELPKFRATLETLLANGILKKGTKAATDMFAFAELMERKLVATKAARNVDAAVNSGRDKRSRATALANVQAAIGVVEGHRELVHLVDVQTSVQSSLSKSSTHSAPVHRRYGRRSRGRDDGEGLDSEDDSEEHELRDSFIYNRLKTGPDTN